MDEAYPNRKILTELGYEDTIIFTNPDYDAAIFGVSSDGRVVYDYDEMVQQCCIALIGRRRINYGI